MHTILLRPLPRFKMGWPDAYDRPTFTKLARVVVQLGQSQDVFGYLNDVTFSKLDGDREGDGNLEAVVARDASFKAICVQKAVAACPLPEDATLDGILASFSDVRMVVIAVQALAATVLADTNRDELHALWNSLQKSSVLLWTHT